MLRYRYLLLLIFLCGFSLITRAQVYSGNSQHRSLTDTSNFKPYDSIFVFYGSTSGQLTAKSPYSGNGFSMFIWWKWNMNTGRYDFIKRDTSYSKTQDTINNLGFGYYKVTISAITGVPPAFDTTIYSWVVIDNSITVNLSMLYYSCKYIELEGKSYGKFDSMYYYQISNNAKIYLPNSLNATWYRNGAEMDGGSGKYYSVFTVANKSRTNFLCYDYPSPADTTYYKIKLQDTYGNVAMSDSFKFKTPITTRAKFIYKTKQLTGSGYPGSPYEYNYADTPSSNQGAPLEVGFINKSLNGKKFVWYFVDTSNIHNKHIIMPDTAITYDTVSWNKAINDYYTRYTYLSPTQPGYPYKPYLVSFPKPFGPAGTTCQTDTFPGSLIVGSTTDTSANSNNGLIVDPSAGILTVQGLIPTVFTPNSDGTNDMYYIDETKLKEYSIRNIRVDIYTRTGFRVYAREGPPSYSPDMNFYNSKPGWDGKHPLTHEDMPEGVYFVTVILYSWDDDVYKDTRKEKNKVFTSYLYLIRMK